MNIAVILSGGSGSRMKGGNIPKQYIEVGGKSIICYGLETFQEHPMIDAILIVADEKYQETLDEWMEKGRITKFADYAPSGRTRTMLTIRWIHSGWISRIRWQQERLIVLPLSLRLIIGVYLEQLCRNILQVSQKEKHLLKELLTIGLHKNKVTYP